MSHERIDIRTPNHSITPNVDYYGTKPRLEFDGSCLKQHSVIFNHKKVVNIHIVYEISKSINISDYPALENCLFGAVSLIENADIDRYGYSGYGTGFDRNGSFSFLYTGMKCRKKFKNVGRNVTIFGEDMSLSTKIDRKKDILISGKGPTQGPEHTLSAEKMYSINFTEQNKKIFTL